MSTAYGRITIQNAATFYAALRSALGFGALWMRIDDDGEITFHWHPDDDYRVGRMVSMIAIDQGMSIEAMANMEALAMRQKYREMVPTPTTRSDR